jgi:hypothetical protein
MKQTKIFIISLNSLTTDFWKQHLSLDKTIYWHWTTPEHGVNNYTTVWPDIIVLDAYWAKEAYTPYLNKLLKVKSNTKIFCLTPKSENKIKLIHPNLHVSRLDDEFLNKINEIIHEKVIINQLKQSA